MFTLDKPDENQQDMLRQMCAALDDEQASVTLFEPMLEEDDGLWFSSQVFALEEGEHPHQLIRRLCQPDAAEFRTGAKAVGLVSFGTMFKLPTGMDQAAFIELDDEAKARLPRVRVRTQLIVAGAYAWAKTAQLDQEGALDVPSVIEEVVESSPLIQACQYLLALAAGIVPDPPTGGEG